MSDGQAKQAILERVRKANGRQSSRAASAEAWEKIPRTYVREARHSREGILELLEDRLHDYDAHVLRSERGEVARAVVKRLQERGNPRMVMASGIPAELLPVDASLWVDSGGGPAELDRFDGVLSTATLAIAQTGTLVLQNVEGQGRRALSLVPDYHLCLVAVADVVETVSEAMDRLAGTSTLPTTFISGPSATADIEMTRIKGVHGPRFLDVILFA